MNLRVDVFINNISTIYTTLPLKLLKSYHNKQIGNKFSLSSQQYARNLLILKPIGLESWLDQKEL